MKKQLVLVLLMSPLCFFAQGYKVHVQGQTQQAMGNAGTGLAQDGSTIFYNPAGMSFLKGNSVSIGGNGAIVKSTFLAHGIQQTTESETPISTPVTLYATYGFDSTSANLAPLKFGIGVYTGFGSSVAYPAESPSRYIANSLNITTLSIQPTASYKFNDEIGIGVGFVYTIGKLKKEVDVPVFDSAGTIASSVIEGNFKGGIGFNAGIYYTPTDKFAIGVTYRSGSKMELNDKATATFSDIPTTLTDSFPSGEVGATVPLPQNIALGLSYKITDKFVLAIDANFVGFKVFDTLNVDFASNDEGKGSVEDQAFLKGFQNAYSFHLGGQYEVIDNLNARLGLRYVMSAIPDSLSSPEGAEANRLVYSGGLGYSITDQLSVDASYTFESVFVEEDYHKVYNMEASYKTYASLFGLSVSYKF